MIVARYLFKSSVAATLIVLAVLLMLQGFITFLSELKDMGAGDYHALQALQYVVLCAPYELQKCLPMALLLGHLLGLGSLAHHREILVLRVAGLSCLRILKIAFVGALVMVICISTATEIIAPKGRHLAKLLKTVATTQGQTLQTHYGTWVRYHNYFVHIEKIISDKKLEKVTWYEFDKEHRIHRASDADVAQYQQGQWHLKNLRETYFENETIRIAEQPSAVWQIKLNPKFLLADAVPADEMSLPMLYRYNRYLQHNHRQGGEYGFIFWKRLLQPLAMALMVFLSLPFVFGPQRQANMGRRLFYGCLLGFGFYLLNEFLGPFSLVYQVPPWLAALLPVLLFSGIALSFTRRKCAG